jgi:hypothetical protein
MTFKRCSKCGLDKEASNFNSRSNGIRNRLSRCRDCKNAYDKSWREKNPRYEIERYSRTRTQSREKHLVRKYGVSLAIYDAMLTRQGGRCAVCGKLQDKAFDVDHCHSTGNVRGLLCTNCNRMIGHSGDSPWRLRYAADYLERSRLPSSRKSRSKSCAKSAT